MLKQWKMGWDKYCSKVKIINLTIIGDVNNIECGGHVEVTGNVNGDIDCGGHVTIKGNYGGGNIDCGGSVKIIK